MNQNAIKILLSSLLVGAMLFISSCGEGGKEKKDVAEANSEIAVADSVIESVFDVSDYDFMYFADGKFNFYRMSDSVSAVYEGEDALIMNYTFQANTFVLYYSVCTEDSTVAVKKIDFSKENPEPEFVVDFGLNYNKCISETYDGYSPVYVNKDASMIVVMYDFSWESYGFCREKVYVPETGKFKNDLDWGMLYSDDNGESDFGKYSFSSRPGDVDADEEYDVGEDHVLNLYCMNEKTKEQTCISDKIDFFSISEEQTYPEELEVCSLSPDKKYVLYYAVLSWGDYPHGPYCVASVDGSCQQALVDTDVTITSSICWCDNGSLLYVGSEPRPKTDPEYDEYNTTKPCIKLLKPGCAEEAEVIVHNTSRFLIMQTK